MTAKSKCPYKVGDEPAPGYRVVRFLGKGGFGEVWEAKAPGGAGVALKVIPDLSSKLGRKEFRALELIKDIHHPNLVSINAFWLKDGDGNFIDDAPDRGGKFIADPGHNTATAATLVASTDTSDPLLCELIIAMSLGNKNLFARLEEFKAEGMAGIPAAELLDYMDDTARAIDYLNKDSYAGGAKRAGVQHCDIKPHNILIVGNSAQVCDFGLARVQGEKRATASLSATVAYAAPELLEKPGDPSPTTDQYSLAITYYELKTGSLPYRDKGLLEMMTASLGGQLFFSGVGPAEAAVLRRATARVPSERFPSAVAMVKALRSAVEQSESAASSWRAGLTRRRARIVLTLALVLAAGFFAWWGYQQSRQSAKPQRDSEQELGQPNNAEPLAAEKIAAEKEESQMQIAAKREAAEKLGKLLQTAEELTARNEFAAAIAEYDRAIELAPHSAAAFFGRGVAFSKSDQLDAAINDFATAWRLDYNKELGLDRRQELAQTYLQRAQIRRQSDDFHGAAQDCALIIEQLPDFAADAYSERGACARDQGHFSQAISDLSEAIRLSPRNPLALSRRGYVYLTLKQFDAALRDLNEAIRLEPNDLDYLNRGILYSVTGRSAEALAEFTGLIQRDPRNDDAFYQRALVYRDLKEYPEAIADFKAALKIEPNNADALALLATLLACGPDATTLTALEAVQLAQQACALSAEKDPSHLDALAAVLAKTGDFPQAVRTAEKAVQLAEGSSDEATYRVRLGLYKAGKRFLLPPAPPPR